MVFIVLTCFRVFRLSGIYRKFYTVFQMFGKTTLYFERATELWKFYKFDMGWNKPKD